VYTRLWAWTTQLQILDFDPTFLQSHVHDAADNQLRNPPTNTSAHGHFQHRTQINNPTSKCLKLPEWCAVPTAIVTIIPLTMIVHLTVVHELVVVRIALSNVIV
jgi:hypothetical protein